MISIGESVGEASRTVDDAVASAVSFPSVGLLPVDQAITYAALVEF
jgi:hypothetical protein